jgi:alcohol dehydrogenase class IV
MLAHVLRYNAEINSDRQASLTELLELGESNLADAIESLVRSLGLPTRLRDAGLSHDKLAEVAENAMSDRWVKTNPRPVADSNEVLRILQDAW